LFLFSVCLRRKVPITSVARPQGYRNAHTQYTTGYGLVGARNRYWRRTNTETSHQQLLHSVIDTQKETT